MSLRSRTATVAWLLTATYYFYQYALRSAPAVMMPDLSDAFGLSATAGFLLAVSGGAATMHLEDYQTAFHPLLYGVAIAIVLTLFLQETGPAARRQVRAAIVA